VYTIDNPGDARVQAVFIRAHLKMMMLGMTNSRISKTQMLRKASAITGKSYTSKGIALAILDLTKIIA
jgi:hypothetical protein